MNQQISDEIVNVSNLLQQKLAATAPVVHDVVLATYRVHCLSHILLSIFWVLIGAGLIVAASKAVKNYKNKHIDANICEDAIIVPISAGYIFGILITAFSLFSLLHMYYFVGLFKPEIILAHNVLAKFLLI